MSLSQSNSHDTTFLDDENVNLPYHLYSEQSNFPLYDSSNTMTYDWTTLPQSTYINDGQGQNITRTDSSDSFQSDVVESAWDISPYRSRMTAHHQAQRNQILGNEGHSFTSHPLDREKNGESSHPSYHIHPSLLRDTRRMAISTIQERRRLTRAENRMTQTCKDGLEKHSQSPVDTTAPKHPISIEGNKILLNKKQQNGNQVNNHQDMFALLTQSLESISPAVSMNSTNYRPSSFVISDAQHPDQPIIFCSDSFCSMTGYERQEVIGRNCRFLQAPGGIVEKGSMRTSTDTESVRHLQETCSQGKACQAVLINYRRDKSPFVNLLNIIPIFANDQQTNPIFLIGSQMEVKGQLGIISTHQPPNLVSIFDKDSKVEQEKQMTKKRKCRISESSTPRTEDLSRRGTPTKDASKHTELSFQDSVDTGQISLLSTVFDHFPDLLYVLSLKGFFLCVSSSVNTLLGYKAEELIGKNISSFCHPSDATLVARDLRESTRSNIGNTVATNSTNNTDIGNGNSSNTDKSVQKTLNGTQQAGQLNRLVKLNMRMRTKQDGYLWMESIGKVCSEQGKNRKVIVLSGRIRPEFNLCWSQIRPSMQSNQMGFWTQMSRDGLILNVFGNMDNVLSDEHNTKSSYDAASHIKEMLEVKELEMFQEALKTCHATATTTTLSHRMKRSSKDTAFVSVRSTFIPAPEYGKKSTFVFVYTCRNNGATRKKAKKPHKEQEQVQRNVNLKEDILIPSESESWMYQLHQLRVANKQLREKIEAYRPRTKT